ncbi:VOC family protein [Fulvivirga sedimenti]|uniref:VOC family protein n=1 Tax=Fulvivirga sedimenti TaxID=2879465 RepID=A0A9X1L0J5_9BACT|nr:VOC family protein [Fulvivirga sedimenti]MCA6074724.1 VOC family protein [Fulvivirga sedimenti]MCA6075901.1 VOC family protein [Fulvivirga sedimenti]MCA6077029.1 VOC family protein [Fulvivirga sedimenti]
MKQNEGIFRFTYFTDKYPETFDFYENKLGFALEHSWDRSDDDKGALFKIGQGVIEILQRPENPQNNHIALDYRVPQGVFTGIQVSNIDELFGIYKEKELPFIQEIIDQPWGHRSFYIQEPNGLVLGFYQEQF